MKKILLSLAGLAVIIIVGAVALTVYPSDDAGPAPTGTAKLPLTEQVARGAYLAKAGDCMACHTTRGGPAYAGGRTLQTPFGGVVTPNITADRDTGIGSW